MVGLGSSKNLQQKTAFIYCPKTHEKTLSHPQGPQHTHTDSSTHKALPPALIAEIDAVHEVG